jgi:hypothetical protein
MKQHSTAGQIFMKLNIAVFTKICQECAGLFKIRLKQQAVCIKTYIQSAGAEKSIR